MAKKHFNFRLEESLQGKFKEKAVREGTTPTALLTQWIENYCNDKNATTQQQPATTTSNDNIEERIQRLENEDELNAALFGRLESRLLEVEAKLASVTQRQQVTTEEGESNDNDNSNATTEEEECNDSNNNDATTEEEERNDNDNSNATTEEEECNDNNSLIGLREDLIKITGIDEEKALAREISHELGCGYQKALNRVQGKPKNRLDKMDKKIEKEIERYHQERIEL